MSQVYQCGDTYTKAIIALGANLCIEGRSPACSLTAALTRLAGPDLRLSAVSRFFSTPSFPAGSGPDYVNAAAVVETALQPESLLARLHEVEAALGRTRTARWEARVVDLDLVAVEDRILPDAATQAEWRSLPLDQQMQRAPDRLILPHPRLQDRAFVLVPLADVAPGWVHPATGLDVRSMLSALPPAEVRAVRPLQGAIPACQEGPQGIDSASHLFQVGLE